MDFYFGYFILFCVSDKWKRKYSCLILLIKMPSSLFCPALTSFLFVILICDVMHWCTVNEHKFIIIQSVLSMPMSDISSYIWQRRRCYYILSRKPIQHQGRIQFFFNLRISNRILRSIQTNKHKYRCVKGCSSCTVGKTWRLDKLYRL